jgi:hypothetical protein
VEKISSSCTKRSTFAGVSTVLASKFTIKHWSCQLVFFTNETPTVNSGLLHV